MEALTDRGLWHDESARPPAEKDRTTRYEVCATDGAVRALHVRRDGPHGKSMWRDHYAPYLVDHKVAAIADNDPDNPEASKAFVGQQHMVTAIERLRDMQSSQGLN